MSRTYLVGEKLLESAHYEDGLSPGDNETMYSGFCSDLHRFAGAVEGSIPFVPPLRDDADPTNWGLHVRFGAAHPSGFNMAYCDGSVRFVAYEVDPEVHLRAGHRNDMGVPLELLDYLD